MNMPEIALGAWAWGNDGTFGDKLTEKDLKPVFDAAVRFGLNLWDTAYAYGMGESERILGKFVKNLDRKSYFISDKFTPQAADRNSSSPVKDMIEMQVKIMGLDRFDIYWIHNAMDAPCKAFDLKLTKEDIGYLEELYVPHALSGVMAQNRLQNADKTHIWHSANKNIGVKI